VAKPAVYRLLRTVFGVALFAALVWVVGPIPLARVLVAADPRLLAFAALAYGVMVGVKTWRWRTVLAIQEIALPARHALRAYGLGMLWGAVTPGRVGQHFKAVALIQRGVSFERAVAGTVVDQLLDFVVIAALLPVAVVHFGHKMSQSAWVAIGSLALAAVGLAVLARFGRARFGAAAAEISRLGRRAFKAPLLLAVLSTGLYFVSLDLAARAVGIGVGIVTIALATVGSMVVEMAPVTVAGLGVREAALLTILSPLGVGAASILAFTVIVRAMQIGIGAVAYVAGSGTILAPERAFAPPDASPDQARSAADLTSR
jgi:uncharacterized membrane protein YbhN (UPF0104 family)